MQALHHGAVAFLEHGPAVPVLLVCLHEDCISRIGHELRRGLRLAEDLDTSQSSPPKSDFSTAKKEMSREWMFSRTLTVKTDEKWMLTRTRKGSLTLEDSDFIETMGDAFKETYSPRVPAELTCFVVIGDSSKLELDDSDESGSGLIDLPIRGYLAANLRRKTCEPRIMASVD